MTDNEDDTRASSDDEVNPKAHKKLLAAVSRIGKTQFIKKPTRSEPVLAQDEFHLVKGASESIGKAPESAIFVNDLVKVLNKTSKHLAIGRELKNTKRHKKVLPKPLEKPVAERIQRTVGYEKLKKDLAKWEAVVTKNRVAEQQVFPLDYEEIHVDLTENKKPPEIKIKGALRRALEAVQAQSKTAEENESEEKQVSEVLSKEKLLERKRELAYLKIKQSQKSAKARYQNKIKSKKYHKLLKRQKLKEQIKEFELLQAENPELALEKLEKLEKNRILERASLRHKNTGTWAKNLQIRAKYDRDVRKDLAEQVAISKELTSKLKEEEEYESGDELEEKKELTANGNGTEDFDPFNVWSSKKNEVEEFVGNYRKYWLERNNAESEKEKNRSTENVITTELNDDRSRSSNQSGELESDSILVEPKKKFDAKHSDKAPPELKKSKIGRKTKLKKVKVEIESGWLVEDCHTSPTSPAENSLLPDRKTNVKAKGIDDIFDEAEDAVKEKVAEKLKKLKGEMKSKERGGRYNKSERRERDYLDLSFKQQSSRPEFDEELLETPANATLENEENNKIKLQTIANNPVENVPDKHTEYIDPANVASIKAKTFQTDLTEAVNTGEFLDECDDNDVEVDKQLTLAKVYEDDDFDADFEKEREDERKKNSTEEIDLRLPGWGSWAGCGLSAEKRRRRFVLKFPKEEKRRDDNKEKVYINENEKKKLKQHLVSDLPFPFTSVKDYEASIRAPIGPDFVPETAFRMLTRPSVVTKMGQVIEPMDKDILVKPPKRPRTVVDARIEKLNKKSRK